MNDVQPLTIADYAERFLNPAAERYEKQLREENRERLDEFKKVYNATYPGAADKWSDADWEFALVLYDLEDAE